MFYYLTIITSFLNNTVFIATIESIQLQDSQRGTAMNYLLMIENINILVFEGFPGVNVSFFSSTRLGSNEIKKVHFAYKIVANN